MTFEKDFPSLKHVWVRSWGTVKVSAVMEHCLDKQRVGEAFRRYLESPQTLNDAIEFEKELGL